LEFSSNHVAHVHQHTNLVGVLPASNSNRSSGFGWGRAKRRASCCCCCLAPFPSLRLRCERGGRRSEDLSSQLPWLPPSPPLSSSTCTSSCCCSSSRRPLRSLVSRPALPSPILISKDSFFLVILFTAAPARPFFYPALRIHTHSQCHGGEMFQLLQEICEIASR
jgi:hypothetical protein